MATTVSLVLAFCLAAWITIGFVRSRRSAKAARTRFGRYVRDLLDVLWGIGEAEVRSDPKRRLRALRAILVMIRSDGGGIPLPVTTLVRHPKAPRTNVRIRGRAPWDPRVHRRRTALTHRNSWMPRPSLGMTSLCGSNIVQPTQLPRLTGHHWVEPGNDACESRRRQSG